MKESPHFNNNPEELLVNFPTRCREYQVASNKTLFSTADNLPTFHLLTVPSTPLPSYNCNLGPMIQPTLKIQSTLQIDVESKPSISTRKNDL